MKQCFQILKEKCFPTENLHPVKASTEHRWKTKIFSDVYYLCTLCRESTGGHALNEGASVSKKRWTQMSEGNLWVEATGVHQVQLVGDPVETPLRRWNSYNSNAPEMWAARENRQRLGWISKVKTKQANKKISRRTKTLVQKKKRNIVLCSSIGKNVTYPVRTL